MSEFVGERFAKREGEEGREREREKEGVTGNEKFMSEYGCLS